MSRSYNPKFSALKPRDWVLYKRLLKYLLKFSVSWHMALSIISKQFNGRAFRFGWPWPSDHAADNIAFYTDSHANVNTFRSRVTFKRWFMHFIKAYLYCRPPCCNMSNDGWRIGVTLCTHLTVDGMRLHVPSTRRQSYRTLCNETK